MKTVLFIHTYQAESINALIYTKSLAHQLKTNILVMYEEPPVDLRAVTQMAGVTASDGISDQNAYFEDPEVLLHKTADDANVSYLSFDETHNKSIHELVSKYNIGLIVKGTNGSSKQTHTEAKYILSKTLCPLLLVPDDAPEFTGNIGYLADLRYCKREIISFMNQLQGLLNTQATVCNISASGLPDLADNYATSLFKETLNHICTNSAIKLMNIRERKLKKTLDVLVHIMHIDLFALSYSQSHYNDLLSEEDSDTLTNKFHMPLLLFPS